MAALQLLKLENATFENGLAFLATLDRAPTGTLLFWASVLPGTAPPGNRLTHAATWTLVSNALHTYRVQVRNGTTEPPLLHRRGYYVVAQDDVGVSNEQAEWLAEGLNTDWLNQVNDFLHDTLMANRPLLNRGLELALGTPNWPNGVPALTKSIHRGTPVNEQGSHPGVCHNVFSMNEDHWGLPYSDKIDIRASIQAYSIYQAGVNWSFVLQALGGAVWHILNSPPYLRAQLDCGLRIYDAFARNTTYTEFFDAALGAWVCSCELGWECFLNAGAYDPTTT